MSASSPLPAAADVLSAPIPWIGADAVADAASPEARVLFARRIARRNFAGFPFWVSCTPETCARLAEKVRAHATARGLGEGVSLATLAAIDPGALGALRERMRLPERPGAFAGKRDFKLLFMGDDPAEHALFGEAEHWIRVRVLPALPTVEETRGADDDATLFARSEAWGWLTSDPVCAGPGEQFEAGLHLPALAAGGKTGQMQRAMDAMGFALYPLSLRNPGTAEAGFFRLLSGGALGATRAEATERFNTAARALLKAEGEAWDRWIAREPNLLDDRMHRALNLLQEARRMDYAELLFLSSFARAGAYAGIFPAALLPRLEELRVRAQPHHLGISAGISTPGDAEEENLRRAAAARALLQGMLRDA
jgi:hypothetical protein